MEVKSETRPWLRYLARNMDIAIYTIVLIMMVTTSAVILGFLGTNISFLSTVPQFVFSILYICFLIIIEPMVLAHWQTTPGKSLLKIKINKSDDSKITYSDAFVRTFSVWFKGLAFGIPLISLLTQVNAYGNLRDKGITSWDSNGNFNIIHETVSTWRIILSTIIVVCMFVLYISMEVGARS